MRYCYTLLGPTASIPGCAVISTWFYCFLVDGKAQAQLVMLYSIISWHLQTEVSHFTFTNLIENILSNLEFILSNSDLE